MKKLLLATLLTTTIFAEAIEDAIKSIKLKDAKKSKEILQPEARKLNSKASYLLGYMFYYGEGGEFIN